MILRLVWENVAYRPLRTLLSVLLIGVPVMLILALVGVSRGFMEDSKKRAAGVGFDIMVRPPGSSFTSSGAPMPEKMVAALAHQPHVKMTTGVLTTQNGSLWETLAGIDYPAFEKMSGGFIFVEGHRFQQPDDVLVDTAFAAEQRPALHAGSIVKLLNRLWHVAGIVEPGKLAHVFVPLTVLQDLNNSNDHVTQIYLQMDDPKNIESGAASLKDLLPGYPIYTKSEWLSLSSVDQIPAVGVFIKVIIGIGVITALIVVSLSMYMAVLQRTREIGILKSLGATRGFVMRLILWEAVVMGVGGTIVGIGLSYLSRAALMKFVATSLPQAVVPDWWLNVLGIALASALLGAIYPGMIAVRQDPIEALSYE